MNDKLICSRDKISSIASALRERTNTNGTYTLDTMSNIISNIGNKNIVNITGLTPGEILNVSKGSYSTTITADEDGNASFISYELGTYKFESQLTSRIAQINLTNIFGITLSRLPAAYQEVEYLQSTGTQYISTNFYYDGVDDKQLRLVWYPTASMAGKAISGYEQSGVAMRWFFTSYGQAGQNAQYMLYANYNNSSQSILQSVGVKYDATFTAKDGTLTATEVLTEQGYSHTYTPTTTSFPDNKLRLFCNSPNQASSIRLYLAQMWSEGELKYDLVPCYRKSDNKPGMYDIINNEFYINAGTGEFGVGPSVN